MSNSSQICLLVLISSFVLSGCADTFSPRPNIVVINIDDLGWKDLSFAGSEYYETPNLDLLAAQGMVFTNGYAAAANCAPSRASLLTGLWTTRHGIYTVNSSERGRTEDRRIIPTKNLITLDRKFVTIAQLLQQNGYTTCHAGKWHLSQDPRPYGFDMSIGGGHNGHPRSYYPPYGNVALNPPGEEYLTDYIMTRTLDFVDSVSTSFFLYYSPYTVHTPIQPVDSLLPKYLNKVPWKGQSNPKYGTMVENMDRNIGRLVQSLKAKGVFENTFIAFTSDNGGLYGITKQRPLRAGKGSYYEGGIRVPFFFHWSGQIEAQTRDETPITNLDLFPTLLDVAQITSDVVTDGQSLLGLLKGEQELPDRSLFWHFPIYLQAYNPEENENRDLLFRTRPGAVIRKGPWKLHYYFEDKGVELYNLANDVSERMNVADSQIEVGEDLMTTLQAWWQETSAPLPSEANPDFVP